VREKGLETAIRVGGAVVVTAAALLAAVLESFLVPYYIAGIAVPVAGAIAFVANWRLAALAVYWTGGRWSVVLTSAAWFAVVLAASMPTDGGSLVITSGFNGYVLLLAGTAGIALALWQYFRPRPNAEARAARGPAAPAQATPTATKESRP
jgi:glutathione S-transferase